MNKNPGTFEFQGDSRDIKQTPTIPLSETTADAIDKIYETQLPHIPCLELPDLEATAAATCPDSIKAIWAVPEHTFMRGENASTVSNDISGIATDEQELLSSDADTVNVEHFYLRIMDGVTSHTPSLTPTSNSLSVSGSHAGDGAPTPPELPASNVKTTESVQTPAIIQDALTNSTTRSRLDRIRALGRALISARNRVEHRVWHEGMEDMQRRGAHMASFYIILSMGSLRSELEGEDDIRGDAQGTHG